MKKIILAIALIALIGIGAASYVTHNDSTNLDDIISTNNLISDNENITDNLTIDEDKYLNNSKIDIETINESTHKLKLNKINNEVSKDSNKNKDPVTTTDSIISKDDMLDMYNDLYNKLIANTVESNSILRSVEISDLKTFDNGTEYYTITVEFESDNSSNYVKHDQIANIKPELIEKQEYEIKGVVNMIYYGEDEKQEVEDTYEYILNRSHNRYNRNFNQSPNDYYSLSTFKTPEFNELAYYVMVNEGRNSFVYSSNGYTYYDSEMDEYTRKEDNDNISMYEVYCRAVAEEKLQSLDYSEYLSLGESEIIVEPQTYQFKFDVIYSKDGKSENIGYIIMDAYTREVVEFNVKNPEVNNTSQVDNITNDNNTLTGNNLQTENNQTEENITTSE